MLIDIQKIVVKERIRKDFGDIAELAEDIQENGLINPPVVNKSYELLAGERRLRACKSLGWQQIEIRMMDTRDAEHELKVEISENDVRKDFTKAERVDYMKRLLRIEQAKARERQASTLKQNVDTVRQNSSERQNSAEVGRSRDAVSEQFNISHDTMRKEIAIADNRELLGPADFADWDEGRLSTNKAYQKIKAELERQKQQNTAQAVQLSEQQEQIAALQSRKPEVMEVIKEVEVFPKDYEEVKQDRDKARKTAARWEEEFAKMRKDYFNAEDRVKKLESQIGADRKLLDANLTINQFTQATHSYIQRYGGHIWAFTEINNVDEPTKLDFIKAIQSLDAFAQQLLRNLEGDIQ